MELVRIVAKCPRLHAFWRPSLIFFLEAFSTTDAYCAGSPTAPETLRLYLLDVRRIFLRILFFVPDSRHNSHSCTFSFLFLLRYKMSLRSLTPIWTPAFGLLVFQYRCYGHLLISSLPILLLLQHPLFLVHTSWHILVFVYLFLSSWPLPPPGLFSFGPLEKCRAPLFLDTF